MKFSRFVRLIKAGLGDSDPEIDYIDVDLCYCDFDNPDSDACLCSEPGREKRVLLRFGYRINTHSYKE